VQAGFHCMPLLWLKVAVGFYAFGLLYAIAAASRPCNYLSKIVLPLAGMGMVFHFVSLTEGAVLNGHFSLTVMSIYESESLLAFVILSVFLLMYWRYRTLSPGIFIFPLVFLLTFASSIAQQPMNFDNPVVRGGWIAAHVALIFTGYAALFLSFGASILYLLQERSLKAKRLAGYLQKLPALEVIDDIGYKSLLLGFPFMTFGLILGAVIAQSKFGSMYFLDPKILLSLLMWAVYMVLLYTRWSSGWRGRKAAYLATFAFLAAVSAWAANYFSGVHRFVAQ
jgi:ABC-type transport system involved in cytochrome c biogenesis permease subunit